jgi:hypothetical protein
MKIPASLFVLLHTGACCTRTGYASVEAFKTLKLAADRREFYCCDDSAKAYGCRLIRYDQQGNACEEEL